MLILTSPKHIKTVVRDRFLSKFWVAEIKVPTRYVVVCIFEISLSMQ